MARHLHRRSVDGGRAALVPLVSRAVRVHRDVDPLEAHARGPFGEANPRAVLRAPWRHHRARVRAHERPFPRQALARGIREVELAGAASRTGALDRWTTD